MEFLDEVGCKWMKSYGNGWKWLEEPLTRRYFYSFILFIVIAILV